jgi:hypothetical protein
MTIITDILHENVRILLRMRETEEKKVADKIKT